MRDTLRLQHDYESQGLLGVFLTSSIKLTDLERSLDWHDNSYCIMFFEFIHTINNFRLKCPEGVKCECMTFDVVRKTLQGLIDSDVTSHVVLMSVDRQNIVIFCVIHFYYYLCYKNLITI